MNASVIVSIIVVAFAIATVWRSRKKGGCCSCGESCCHGGGECHCCD